MLRGLEPQARAEIGDDLAARRPAGGSRARFTTADSRAMVALTRIGLSSMTPCCLRSSGTRPMPAFTASVGERISPACRSSEIVPLSSRSAPKISARDFGAARADQAAEADDLAGAHGEADVAHHAPGVEIARRRAAPRRSCARPFSGNSADSGRPTIMRMISSIVTLRAWPRCRRPGRPSSPSCGRRCATPRRAGARCRRCRRPGRAGRAMISCSRSASCVESTAVGSSKTMILTSRDSALAISTTC